MVFASAFLQDLLHSLKDHIFRRTAFTHCVALEAPVDRIGDADGDSHIQIPPNLRPLREQSDSLHSKTDDHTSGRSLIHQNSASEHIKWGRLAPSTTTVGHLLAGATEIQLPQILASSARQPTLSLRHRQYNKDSYNG